MTRAETDLKKLLSTLAPSRRPGVYVFSSIPLDSEIRAADVVATFREDEGLTVVVDERTAIARGWAVLYRAAWITLTVHSDLEAVGLTAAFSSALGRAGISCNVVAAAYHDHLFVPYDEADRAMGVLAGLQRAAVEERN